MKTHVFPPARILVPSDLGAASKVALSFARLLHELFGSKVQVMHAHYFDPPPYFSSGDISSLKRGIRKATHAAEAFLRKESASVLGFEPDVHVVEKAAVEAILHEAVHRHADLVIMGTHGRSGAQRLWLGSVAEQVLRRCKIPVLAVREISDFQGIGSVLCPYNFSNAGKAALNYAADIAESADARLTVLHAQEEGAEPLNCLTVEEHIGKRCRVEEVLLGGNAARVILEAAREMRPDIIVMGAEQKPTVFGIFFSSTTERVMQLAEAPVLVVPRVSER